MKREKLIRARIKKGLSQEAAAGLIGVSRNTWSLWERGKEDPFPLNVGELCTFFGVKEPGDLDLEPPSLRRGRAKESAASDMLTILAPHSGLEEGSLMSDTSRREILKHLARALGITLADPLYITSGELEGHFKQESQLLALNDLDVIDNYIEALQRLLLKGEAQYVMQASQNLYTKVTRERQAVRDMRVAETLLHLGMLVGAASEYALPWYQRASAVIEIYNHVEHILLHQYPLNNALHRYYARLQAKRSRQYRVLWQFDECEQECEQGIAHLEDIEEYSLQTHFLCERTHVKATQGDEQQWMQQLEQARIGVMSMPLSDRQKAYNQIDYMQGEGYKRFALHTRKEISMPIRKMYAQLAHDQFTQWDGTTIELPGFESLVMQISKAQCLILLDPQSALDSAKQLVRVVQQSYPSLFDKIHRVMFLAQQRLQMSENEFSQVFNASSCTVYQAGGNIL